MIKNIVRDPLIEKALLEDGFIIAKNFVPREAIQRLADFYDEVRPHDELEKFHFYATTFSQNIEFRKRVKAKIVEEIDPSIQKLFFDYKHLGGNFILKVPSKSSDLIVHQDTDLTDEKLYPPTNIWCPLVDATKENGAIELIPGSHRFYDMIRIPAFQYPYMSFLDEVIGKMIRVEVNQGDALIFNPSVIHRSPSNLSEKERVVADVVISHKEAGVRIHHIDVSNPDAQVEQIAQPDDFLEIFTNVVQNVMDRPQTGQSIQFFDYKAPVSTPEEFESMVAKYSNFATYREMDMSSLSSVEKRWS